MVGAAQAQTSPSGLEATTQSVSYTSGIQIQNLSSTTANATVTYYNQDGSQAASQSFQIPGNQSYVVFGNTMQAPAGFSGSAVVSADQPIVANVNLLGSNPTTGESYDGLNNPTTSEFLPLFQQGNSGYNSSLYIQNASSSQNSVSVQFNSGGSTVSTKSFTLPANGSVTVDSSNDGISGRFIGSAVITGSQPIAAALNQTNGSILFSSTGNPTGSSTIYAPLIMTNNSGWTTSLQVQNVGTQATTASLYLNGGSSAIAQAQLGPGQSVSWYPVPGTVSGSRFIGSATVTSSGGVPLVGVVNELNQTTGQGMAYSTFGSGTQTVDMPLVMFNNSGYYTGEQVQNVGTAAATVDLKINGTVVDTKVIQPGQTQVWFSATNIIPGGGKIASASAVAREPGSQIVGIVNEITSPQQGGDTSFSYEGFNQ